MKKFYEMRALEIFTKGAFLVLIILAVCYKGDLARAQCLPQEKVLIKGRLVEIKHPIAVVIGDDGKRYPVRLGPYWYWKKRGYKLRSGERVHILGLKKGKLIFPIIIKTKGQKFLIRDECGIPLWREKP